MGLSAYLTGRLFIDLEGIPIIAVVLLVVIFGGLLGLINGALVAFARVPSMVITLGTLYAYRGINVLWTGSDRINASDMPREFLGLGTGQVLTIPILAIVAFVVLFVAAWFMKHTRGGREFYAIGSDPAAAELYGLKTTKRILTAFVCSGALAGLAGVFYAARYGTVNSQAGASWELDAVGAAVIGGAAIGAMLLATINRALPVLGIPDFWQRFVVGLLILGAIVLDRVVALRQKRRLIESRDQS
jgi:rhamnose transport system permease protein